MTGVSKLSHLSPPSAVYAATDTAAGLSHHSRTPSVLSLPALPPLCPAHPGGLFSCPARANPRLGVSRASRFLVLRKEEQGVGVGQRRQQTGGSEQPREPAVRTERGPTRSTPTHSLEIIKTRSVEVGTTGAVTPSGEEKTIAGTILNKKEEVEEVGRVGRNNPGSVEAGQVGGDGSGQVTHRHSGV